MIDYQEIIDNLETNKVIDLMCQLGADNYIEKDNYIIFPTICHHEDPSEASLKLYYYKDNHFFYCYTECGGMSIFTLLKHYYETRQIEYDWHKDILQVITNCSVVTTQGLPKYRSIRNDYKPKKDRKNLTVYPKEVLDVFVKKYPVEWLKDGISKNAMDKFNIRYSISQNKIIIPHYDVNSNLVGIRGRALNEWEVENVGKYMPAQIENKWYSHPLSLNLYGLNLTKDNINKTKVCYLFESEKSVMQLESFNMLNCGGAVCGSKVNKFQIDLLMRFCNPQEIIVCFDNEEIGKEDKYFNKLYQMCNKYKNYCTMSFVYDREKITKLKDSPTDNGEDVFKELLKGRVRI